MKRSPSFKEVLALAVAALPLAGAAGCPLNVGNEALKPRSLLNVEQRLEPRFHQDASFGRCPSRRLSKFAGGGARSWDWWPCELSLHVLRQNGIESNPLGADYIYAREFAKIDCESRYVRHAQALAMTERCSRSIKEGHWRATGFFSGLVAI
jgi:catalase-peroxidase